MGLALPVIASRGVQAEFSAESRTLLALRSWHGGFGASAVQSLRIITKTGHWRGLWRALGEPEPAPFLERTDGAVFAELGERPTGGFGIKAIDAKIERTLVRLTVAEMKPGRDQVLIQALTRPWAVFLMHTNGRTLEARWQDA